MLSMLNFTAIAIGREGLYAYEAEPERQKLPLLYDYQHGM